MIALESGNRRAEIEESFVIFLRMTGRVRRSKQVVWFVRCTSARKARRLAEGWVERCELAQ